MKRSQRARRISAREQSRRRRQREQQQREARAAEQERQQQFAGQRGITEHDRAASASGIHRIPPGLLGSGAPMVTRTQARGR